MGKKRKKRKKKHTATHAATSQRQQYTTGQVINQVTETMFTAFVQSASHGIGVGVHG